MADNIAVTEGSGKDVATDDVGGKQYQRIKLDLGTDGAAAPALAGAGAVATGVQRITLASDDPAVVDLAAIEVLLGTMDADTGAIKTAVELIDNAISGTEMQVDIVAALPAGTNAIGKLAANSGVDIGDVTLTAGTAAIGKLAVNSGVDIGDVDVTSVIPGVTATSLGKARDSALGATDTGVMALAVRDDTLTTLTPADGDYVPLRVSSTGQLHVTGAGGGTEYTEDVATANPQVGSAIMMERDDALTTVTPVEADWIGLRGTAEGALWIQDFNSDAALALLTTIDSDTNDIKTAVEIIDNAISGSEIQCDIITIPAPLNIVGGGTEATALRVTIANDSTGVVSVDDGGGTLTVDGTVTANLSATDNAVLDTIDAVLDTINAKLVTGTVIGDVNLGATDNAVLDSIDTATTATQAAVEIMDDWDATHDSAASSDGPQLMGAYDSTKPTAVADGDAVRILVDQYGRLLGGVEPTKWQEDYDSADASGEGEAVKASAASTILVVQSYVISVDAEMWVKLQEEDSSALTGKFWLKAGGGVAITLPDKAPLILGVDSDLEVITEGAGNVSVSVTGYTIPG